MKNFLVAFSLCILMLTGCQANGQEAESLSFQGSDTTLSLGMTQAEVEEQMGSAIACYTQKDGTDADETILFPEDSQEDSASQPDIAFFSYANEMEEPIYITYDNQGLVDSISTYCLYANRPAASFLWRISDAVTYGTTLEAIQAAFPDAVISTDASSEYQYVQIAVGDDGLLAVLADESVVALSLCSKDALFL